MKKLYYGGPILTMDPSVKRVEAVLTENGRIVGVGKKSDFETANAEQIDLEGKTMMPAFVDGHSHALSLGLGINHTCDLMGCGGFDDLLARFRRFREEKGLTHGEPITGKGYDPAIMKEGRHPDARVLDALGFDNPVACVHQSGHVAAYNSVAMERAGVNAQSFVCPEGGFAGRDERGELNGYFEESARGALNPLFKIKYTEEDYSRAMETSQKIYAQNGFGTVQEGSQNSPGKLAHLEQIARNGELKTDLVVYLSPAIKYDRERRECVEKYKDGYVNGLKVGGVKFFLDGSPQARTAWLSRPYEGETDYCGYPRMQDEKLEELLSNAVRQGLQPIAHCNGDAASEQFLSAVERIAQQEEIASLRPAMIHAQTVRYDQLKRMKAVGMMPSFFVGHCFYWGDTHLKNMGERGMRISPMRKAMEEGLVCSIHQDSPVTPPNMLHSVWCAVNRLTRDGVRLGDENQIDCYDALIAATRGGAYTYFEENTKGILRAGAAADFVLLDRDPTAVDPMEIQDICVLETVKSGETIFTL